MKPWTEAAEMRLEQYLNERVLREQMHGEEAIELKEDLRRHIHEEVQGDEAIHQCGLMQLENALGRLDAGYTAQHVDQRILLPSPKTTKFGRGLMLFFGVYFPFAIVIFEWISHFCGSTFFNPIPTVGHGLLLLSVPVLHFWLLRKSQHKSNKIAKCRAWAAGISFGVSLFYALLFLPLAHISVIAILAWGMGMLSLSPIFAWITSVVVSRREKIRAQAAGFVHYKRHWYAGMLAVLGLLMIYEVPALWTRAQVSKALSDDEITAEAGLEALRSYCSKDTLLQQCYENQFDMMSGGDISGWALDRGPNMLTFGNMRRVDQDSNEMRDLYFRVTGQPFNAQKPPDSTKGSMLRGAGRDTFVFEEEWDYAHGGDAVAARVKHLDCKESRFDGHIDSKSRIGYGEWTMVFHNDGTQAREARCQIRLPHGGQVSRLTLWINGEPREAAFGSVGQVKAAYKEVAVVQRRDPVLVNMIGPDTIMMQCFPVPAKGDMKIRIGVTAPLVGDTWSLPRVIEKNFGFADALENSVWMQCDEHFSCVENQLISHRDGEMESLSFDTKTMHTSFSIGKMPKEMTAIWCEDRFAAPSEKFLQAQPMYGKLAAVDKCLVVVDGSYSLQAHREWISRELVGKNVSILLANDKCVAITAEALAKNEFRGGCNNEPALYEALRLAKESPHAAVIWLHGPQPVEISQSERLLQLLERGSNRPAFYEVPVVDGPNRLFEKLGRSGLMKSAPIQAASADKSLSQWIDSLQDGEDSISWVWSRQADANGLAGKQVSDQLARLWAMKKVAETKDSAIAIKYQLVSLVSGAVVLENMEQYARHGLEPVSESSTPAIPNVPEPSSALLILLGAMMACLRRKR